MLLTGSGSPFPLQFCGRYTLAYAAIPM
jgi:hypothetical protein